jgi:secreted trypsin-like serine protease
LIQLKFPIAYTYFIQPICLLPENKGSTLGKVAGWGQIDDDGTIADIARIAEMKSSNILSCVLYINNQLGRIASENTFCAQSTKTSVCKGDSGSGFYNVLDEKAYLKGIVSSAVNAKCSNGGVAVYTDVSKYFGFIKVRIDTNRDGMDQTWA